MGQIDIKELSRMLSARVEDVCLRLLPNGKRCTGQWVAGDVTGAPGKTLKVQLTGEHVGRWTDWAATEYHGDLIDLWEQTRGVSKLEAIREVKDYLGVTDSFASITSKKSYAKPETLASHAEAQANGKVVRYLTEERLLPIPIINRFKVHADTRGFIVYPRYSPGGQVVNRQYVGLKRDEAGKKKVFCDTGCAPSLFGWQALSPEAFTKRAILLCEGEVDCMTWTAWGVDALSISNGSGTTWIDFEWENLEAFETIYISFDMDGKSAENLRKCIARLGIHRCKTVSLPEKDANDCLKAGRTAEDAARWIREAKWTTCKDLSTLDELREKTINEIHPTKGLDSRGWKPKLLQRFDGGIEFLWGEVTVWTGISSQGKSTFLNYIMGEALMEQHRVCIANFETKPEKSLARLIKTLNKDPLPSRDLVNATIDILAERLVFVNRVGCMDAKELFEIMRFAFSRYEIRHFVIDSMMRINNLEEDYPAQGAFLNRLQEFAKTTDCHVHLVCHPRKTANDDTVPGKQDIKGASLIMNNADNILAVVRNMKKSRAMADHELTAEERGMWDARVISQKQRETGWEGGVSLSFCPKTYRYWEHVNRQA